MSVCLSVSVHVCVCVCVCVSAIIIMRCVRTCTSSRHCACRPVRLTCIVALLTVLPLVGIGGGTLGVYALLGGFVSETSTILVGMKCQHQKQKQKQQRNLPGTNSTTVSYDRVADVGSETPTGADDRRRRRHAQQAVVGRVTTVGSTVEAF